MGDLIPPPRRSAWPGVRLVIGPQGPGLDPRPLCPTWRSAGSGRFGELSELPQADPERTAGEVRPVRGSPWKAVFDPICLAASWSLHTCFRSLQGEAVSRSETGLAPTGLWGLCG